MWCLSCNSLSDSLLCPTCSAELAASSFTTFYALKCPTCGKPVLDPIYGCDFCQKALLSYGFYDGILEHLLTEYKHAGKIMASVVLSGLFESMLQSFDHPVLIPIPSSRSGKRSLGFDHMALVTAILGKRLNLQSIHLFRQKANSLYTVLSRSQRQQTSNLEIRKRAAKQMQKLLLQNRTFLILDDIYTTGNTCKRAQELLYTEFSVQASICVIARA
ncbi:ComF family protein [Sphaerochaeta globosa]|uniref:Phosphoribosyltransferase n=1 Tax=Sphaerochaeta globosa (strain ATCC BAA-1886 / DSM 22777 / Buddy) TaxID=158189 RepID=F0RZ16_SPHGB|nr:ComF family protein [Sphaerochaeta globosa]ADY13223.1 hypothetical protein SpiBuddy_1398 [Sphaerochaeta globosa str. Buddy]